MERKEMDYRIHRSLTELRGTNYMEICPGKYSKKHWQDGSLFVSDREFGLAEGIVAKHFAAYDHFAMNDVPKDIGQKITAEWAHTAVLLEQMASGQIARVLNLDESSFRYEDSEIENHKPDITDLLRSLAVACDAFYLKEDWICILGM
jgi:hypothetical protein